MITHNSKIMEQYVKNTVWFWHYSRLRWACICGLQETLIWSLWSQFNFFLLFCFLSNDTCTWVMIGAQAQLSTTAEYEGKCSSLNSAQWTYSILQLCICKRIDVLPSCQNFLCDIEVWRNVTAHVVSNKGLVGEIWCNRVPQPNQSLWVFIPRSWHLVLPPKFSLVHCIVHGRKIIGLGVYCWIFCGFMVISHFKKRINRRKKKKWNPAVGRREGRYKSET